MKTMAFLGWILWALPACCQSYSHLQEVTDNTFLNDANGRPLYLNSNYNAEGSPYFNDDYQGAIITAMNGTVYKNIRVKINLLDRVVQYMAADGKEMIAEIPVKKIVLLGISTPNSEADNIVLQSFDAPLNFKDAPIYQVLDSGRLQLLKKIVVSYRDEKKYGNAGTTRVFERKEILYTANTKGEIKKLQKGKPALLDLLGDQAGKLTSFMAAQQLSLKSDKEYTAVFKFYNSQETNN